MAARNWTVIQLLRRPPTAANQFQWNPAATPPIRLLNPLEGLSAAIHFSGANLASHRWTAAYKGELIRSRVESTRALATALAGLHYPPKTLLVASAVGIYGNRGNELLDESSSPGTGFLADLCRQWEAAASPAAAAGIRVVHLRFGMVLAQGKGALSQIMPWFRLGLGGKFGDGAQYMSWIALPDVVAALFFLLDLPSAEGPYNITAPNPVSNSQFTHILASYLRRPAIFSLPAFALRLGLGEMADETVLASTRAYPARLVATGFEFTCPSLVHALPSVLNPKLDPIRR